MAKLSISKAWDDSRPIIGRDGQLMFIIALAMVVLPQTLLYVINPEQTQLGVGGGIGSDGDGPSFLESILAFVGGLLNIIGSIAISYLALTRGTQVADGLRRGLQRLLPTIGAVLILIVIIAAIVFVVALLVVGGSPERFADPTSLPNISPMAALAALVALGLVIWAAVRFMLMTPVIAAEDVGPIGILKRSWSLTRGHFWRLLGFLLLFAIGALVFTAAVSVIAGLGISLVFGDTEPYSIAALATGLVGGIAGAALTIVYSVIVARIYLQLAGKPADPDVETLRPGVPDAGGD